MRYLPAADAKPLLEMNTTPLIDVLLVLLVMLIITIPPQTNAVKFDLPVGPVVNIPPPNPIKNELVISRSGALLWNGAPISKDLLRRELDLTQQMTPVPELHLRPDANVHYGTVDEVLAIVKSEHVQKVGFVGEQDYLSS